MRACNTLACLGSPTTAPHRCLAASRFGKKVPPALVELVEECWAPSMEDRPDFKDITQRFQIIWGAQHVPSAFGVKGHLDVTCVALGSQPVRLAS